MNLTGGTFNVPFRVDVGLVGGTGVLRIGGTATFNHNAGEYLLVAYNGNNQRVKSR